jgi:hypothetical protein
MGIIVDNVAPQDGHVYDRVLMTRLLVTQGLVVADAPNPVYAVTLDWRMYRVDGNGDRVYRATEHTAYFEDYLATAITALFQGSPDLLSVLRSVELSISALVAHQIDGPVTVT